jgi:hypothetical protein
MRTFVFATAVAFAALAASWAYADGLLYNLPKDGTWATYEITGTATIEVKTYGIQKLKNVGTLKIASVGQVSEAGQPCRWIEIKMEMEIIQEESSAQARRLDEALRQFDEKDKSGGGSSVKKAPKKDILRFKVLSPEKYLVKGDKPLDHLIRAWFQADTAKPSEWKDPKDIDRSPLPIILSDPWKDSKQLEKAEVESKLGKQMCEGNTGSLEFTMRNSSVMKCKLENRLHSDAPFGVVVYQWILENQHENELRKMELNLKLSDFGDKAVSEMPDAK